MFRFKQFSVADDLSSMKVGTDAVLLGAWMHLPEGVTQVLDVGCGCGVISLMMAQRAPKAQVLGIDIHAPSVAQAQRNAAESPFRNVQFQVADFCQTTQIGMPGTYDLIVSNPPYHTEALQAPSEPRAAARSEAFLPFATLIEQSYTLLKEGAHLGVVIPTPASEKFHTLCCFRGFSLCRKTLVQTTPKKSPKRVLLDFVKGPAEHTLCDTLTLEETPGMRSKTYSELCKNFYL